MEQKYNTNVSYLVVSKPEVQQRTLQIYKNKINQKPGINNELIHWMKNETLSRNLSPDGYEGGLILDEMSIQSNLEFCSRDGYVYLWGFKEVTDESQFIDSILSGKKEIKLATHVLQFVFLGFTGFRFPAPFPDRTD